MRADGRRRSVFGRLYHGETNVNFVGRAKIWFALSGIVLLIGLASLFTRGLNLGIEFEGGTSWLVAGDVSVDAARDTMGSLGAPDAGIQVLGGNEGRRLRVQAEPDAADQGQVSQALADLAKVDISEVQVDSVSPSWGSEITNKAGRALVFFLIAITIYITLRFEWRMAVATLAALIHDILFTVGVYSVVGFEVTPATVIAILTILGYSIYDGIVVFDKVDENAKVLASSGRTTYSHMVNDSLNQVLMRTLNTSITALIPIASLLVIGSFVLGAATLQEFALALLIGLGSGAYSSIFIASPLLAVLKEREPRYVSLRNRLEGRATPLVATGGGSLLRPSGAAAARTRVDAEVSQGNGTGGRRTGAGGPARSTPGADSADGGGSAGGADGGGSAGGRAEPSKAGPSKGTKKRPAGGPSGPIAPRPRKKGKRR